jgi:hypothetical protein
MARQKIAAKEVMAKGGGEKRWWRKEGIRQGKQRERLWRRRRGEIVPKGGRGERDRSDGGRGGRGRGASEETAREGGGEKWNHESQTSTSI